MRKMITFFVTLLLLTVFSVPVSASDNYIMDDAYLLTAQQREELNEISAKISENYGIGIYILTVEDYRDYGEEPEIFDVLWNYYHDHQLGYGPNRQGMILMLSMAERDFATFFYGEDTEYAFNAFGQEELESYFLDNLADDDWYGGFMHYLSASEDFLARAAAGEPVRESPWPMAILFVGIACAISAIATMIQWGKMQNVAMGSNAALYHAQNGFVLNGKVDQFLYQNITRRKIETSSSSGSRAHSGGGGSGRSGKF